MVRKKMSKFKEKLPSFKPAQSRWQSFTILITIAISLLLLGVSMLLLTPECQQTLAIVFLSIGGFGIIFAVGLAIYWLFTGSKDPLTLSIVAIQKDISSIKDILGKADIKVSKDNSTKRTDMLVVLGVFIGAATIILSMWNGKKKSQTEKRDN